MWSIWLCMSIFTVLTCIELVGCRLWMLCGACIILVSDFDWWPGDFLRFQDPKIKIFPVQQSQSGRSEFCWKCNWVTNRASNQKNKIRNSISTIHMKMSIYDCWTSKIGLSDSKGCYTELNMILSSCWVWKRFDVSRKIHQLTNPRWHCGIQSAGHCALWRCRDQVSWSFMSTSDEDDRNHKHKIQWHVTTNNNDNNIHRLYNDYIR